MLESSCGLIDFVSQRDEGFKIFENAHKKNILYLPSGTDIFIEYNKLDNSFIFIVSNQYFILSFLKYLYGISNLVFLKLLIIFSVFLNYNNYSSF